MPQIIPAVLGSAASAAIGGIFNRKGNDRVQGRLGATDAQLRGTRINDFNSTGFSGSVSQSMQGVRSINFSRSEGVQSQLDALMGRSTLAANQYGDLIKQVAPGFSNLRQGALGSLAETERRSIAGLRESLRDRRLAGSSFENVAVGEERERFERLRQEILGGIGVQELQMTAELIGMEFEAAVAGIGAQLEQFNFETQIAASIQNASTALQQSIVAARAGIGEAAAQAQSAAEQGAGQIWAPVIDGLGEIVTEGAKKIVSKIPGIN